MYFGITRNLKPELKRNKWALAVMSGVYVCALWSYVIEVQRSVPRGLFVIGLVLDGQPDRKK